MHRREKIKITAERAAEINGSKKENDPQKL